MKAHKKTRYFRTGLVLAAFLFLWTPLLVSASPYVGGADMTGGGMAADDQSMSGVSGKVVETMNSGGYTYVLVDTGSDKTWVALPQSVIAVGSDIACQPGMVMSNFKSTSLNRSFASIVFSAGLASTDSAMAAGPTQAAVATLPETITVSKAEGPNAQTIAEIFAKKDSLKDKPVAVHAKVVKVSRGILGKNWLHLQDGTGSPTAKTNDLVVTTDSVVEVGAVVTIKGNLSRDRDFGAGYRYGVIIEDAEVISNK